MTSAPVSRSSVREAIERLDVPLRLGRAVSKTLSLCPAVFAVLGLDLSSEGLQIGLMGVGVVVVLGHDTVSSRVGLA